MNKLLWLFCCSALVLVACAKTDNDVVSVWKDETRTGKVNKVFVLAIVKEPAYRRSVEYGIVDQLNATNLRAIPTLDSFPVIEEIDKAAALKMAQEFGIDAVLLVRLVDRKSETVYIGGPSHYNSFYGNRYAGGWHNYYGAGYNHFMAPGYATVNYISTVETAIYDIAADKLLWSTITETKGNVPDEAIRSYLNTIEKPLEESELF